MYKIEKDRLGHMDLFRLKLGGFMKSDEVERCVADSTSALGDGISPFSVVMDIRSLMPLSEDAMNTMKEGQQRLKEKGMVRSAVLVPNIMTKLHYERLAKESGAILWERYFAAAEPNFEEAMNNWMENGKYDESPIAPLDITKLITV
ncbi:MAG: hypothetical protein JXR76_10225 [Deltaproteobacteria bacterium]|nr:hypothetical protein [Deltaproteobacteria bacterium]